MVLVVEVGGKGRVGRVNGDGEFWLSLDCKRVKIPSTGNRGYRYANAWKKANRKAGYV